MAAPKPRRGDPEVTPALVAAHGLTGSEYDALLEALGRPPTFTELGVFSVMWSEHCSYKSSRVHLKNLPTEGPRVLQGPGENAGVVDIGDGMAVAFKMESHNHPSYIEPYQGAATGVGGILRDVFTMGARPIASLDALRFGRPDHPRTPYLVSGVVAGVGGYGNCIGVPTVGGELAFDETYDGNCLVNAFTLGVMPSDRIFRGAAAGVGNPVLYVGAKTGRDGIHGATMASESFDSESEQKRPTVQVGDPFTEKLLLEACLELMATDCIVGIQDMGAAGLTSSSVEMAGRAGTGIELDIDAVPRREEGMTPYELLLSESQERMLMVVTEGRERDARRIFEKWDLDAAVVGRVTGDGTLRILEGGEVVADMPILPLADGCPRYDRPRQRPSDLDRLRAFDTMGLPEPADLSATLVELLGTPELSSKRLVWTQYDHMVQLVAANRPGEADAAVVRVPGSKKGVALSSDVNPRFCYLDPRLGGRHAVAEAARNVSCVGAEPLAITDCLNFGNPEKPEIMWQLAEAVLGIADACNALQTPVVSGNVSLYNETEGKGILPTPTVALVGLLEDAGEHAVGVLGDAGLEIALLGATAGHLGGSAYLKHVHGTLAGTPPPLDLDLEARVQRAVRRLVRTGAVRVAHDCAEGGIAVALAELCLSTRNPGDAIVGLTVTVEGVDEGIRADHLLFGEDASRILVAYPPKYGDQVREVAGEEGVPCSVLGRSGGDRVVIRDAAGDALVDIDLDALRDAHENGLPRALGLLGGDG